MITIKTEAELLEEFGENWKNVIIETVGWDKAMKQFLGLSLIEPDEVIGALNHSIKYGDNSIYLFRLWWPLTVVKIQNNEEYNHNFTTAYQ